MQTRLLLLFIYLFFISCDSPKETRTERYELGTIVPLKWAKNFEITKFTDYIQVSILNKGISIQTFILSSDTIRKTDHQQIIVPITSLASGSCVYSKMIDILGHRHKIKAIDQLSYYYSDSITDYVTNNNILEFGIGNTINTEALISLEPKVMFSSFFNEYNKQLNKLDRLKIPVIFSTSYLEEHPLARAEWIKFFALFIGEYEYATSLFNTIEKDYLNLLKQSEENSSVVINAPYSGLWYLPTHKSYMGKLLNDAHLNLNTKDTVSNGANAFSFEDILSKHIHADIWLNPSIYTTYTQLKNTDTRFTLFSAFKNRRIFNSTKRVRINGGNDYWELGVIRPDLVLSDLINIKKNENLDDLFFFTKLKE